jgi:hypothetical protein
LNPYASYGASTSSGKPQGEGAPGTVKQGGGPESSPTVTGPNPASGQVVASVGNPVEEALARALREASVAGRWDVVAQLARELEARRDAKPGNVVSLADRARKR